MRGIKQGLGLTLAFIQQTLLVRFKGFKNLFALLQYVCQKGIVLAELAFQLLQLIHQFRQLFITTIRRCGHAEAAGHALRQQFELGRELGQCFVITQAFQFVAGPGPALVQMGKQIGNTLNDGRTGGGFGTGNRADCFGQGIQTLAEGFQLLQQGAQFRFDVSFLNLFLQTGQVIVERLQGFFIGQEPDGAVSDIRLLLLQLRIQLSNARLIDVTIILNGQQMAPQLADIQHGGHIRLGHGPAIGLQSLDQGSHRIFCLLQCLLGAFANTLNFLVFIQHQFTGLDDGLQYIVYFAQAGV